MSFFGFKDKKGAVKIKGNIYNNNININDSKNPRGAAKDRHENLGKGEIGLEALSSIVWHPDFLQIPKILETPWYKNPENPKDTWAPYKEEIALLREGH